MWSAKKYNPQVLLTYGADVLAIILSFIMAFWLRFSYFIPPHGIPPVGEYAKALFVVVIAYVWVFRSYGVYQMGRYTRRVEEIFTLLKGVAIGTIILTAFTFFYRGFSYSRLFLVFLWFFASITVSLVRYLLIQWMYHQRIKSKGIRKVLVVGANRNARSLIEWTRQNPHLGYEVIGVLVQEADLAGKHIEGIPILGTLDQYETLIQQARPDEVIVADSNLPKEEVTNLLLHCENNLISFKVAADLFGIVTSSLDVEYVASVPLLGLRPLPLDDPINRMIKRTLDITVSAFSLMATSPICVLAAATIKFTDGGPIFYRQERVGQDGQSFMIYKFRTMRTDAETDSGPVWARKEDDRCTPIGRLLRRFNLDELPQLLNVLWGNMSLVGPRPERPHFVEQFRGEIPRYMSRHKFKSGITGWAQVNGLRGNTSLQERIKYDLYYLENWSLLFDLEILFMTLFAFKNAY
jgi:exopolysaccharide biosynthesis polyprenyl glycosylphosphotransferase